MIGRRTITGQNHLKNPFRSPNLRRKRASRGVGEWFESTGACTAPFRRRRLGYALAVASQPVPASHDDLVRALASLREGDRREVIAAAERTVRSSKRHVVASWRSIRSAIGVVHGEPADAVADTAELHDG